MKKLQSTKWLVLAIATTAVFSGGCLPDNFWIDKWAEIVNGGIIAVINAGLAAATDGNIQI